MPSMTSKLYSTTATIVLGLFAVHGAVVSAFYARELSKFPNKGQWPFNQVLTAYVIIATNSFYLIAAGIGLYAFISQRLGLFLWSSFILLGLFAVQLLHGVTCIRASLEPMNKEIFATFRRFQTDPSFINWLLDYQWQYDCCGIKSYMDWSLLVVPSNHSVPDSCCNRSHKMPVNHCGRGVIAPDTKVEGVKGIINTEGCGVEISRTYQRDIQATGYILLFAAFLSLFVGLALLILQQNTKALRAPGNVVRNTSTEARVVRRVQKQTLRSISSSMTSQMDVNDNLQKVPSYYKTTVAHKPPTGRGRVPRQDSVRNFQTNTHHHNSMNHKTWAQKSGPKYRGNFHQKHRYNTGLATRQAVKSQRVPNDFRKKTNLEMLMHPIETHSTSSATPNPSDMFPFYGEHQNAASSSACFPPGQTPPGDFDPRGRTNGNNGGSSGSKNGDFKIAHYNSLPQVVTFPDGRVETLYHYNTSHLHAPNLRRKHPSRPPKTTFVEGKYTSLTITSTLATIHEENESVKSGNSQASSTCTTTASSSPNSLSKSPSKHAAQSPSGEHVSGAPAVPAEAPDLNEGAKQGDKSLESEPAQPPIVTFELIQPEEEEEDEQRDEPGENIRLGQRLEECSKHDEDHPLPGKAEDKDKKKEIDSTCQDCMWMDSESLPTCDYLREGSQPPIQSRTNNELRCEGTP